MSGSAGLVDPILVELEQVLQHLDPDTLDRPGSLELCEKFHRIERLAAAGKALCSRRICDTGAWMDVATRSPAHWMAATTKTSIGHACDLLDAAERMKDLPTTEQAFRQGRITERQALDMVSAASVDPSCEQYLIEAAEAESLREFHQECRRVRAAALDEDERQRRAHRRRALKHWVDVEGAFRLEGRFTTGDGAIILAALAPFQDKVAHREAERLVGRRRRKRKRDPLPAQWADALVEMARCASSGTSGGAGEGPRALVHVRVDHTALRRGHTVPGEICEVPGAGPIPVGVAHSFMNDAFLAAIFVEGQDILSVVHLGRNLAARLRTALLERDPCCRVPGCGNRDELEIDHLVPIHQGGTTSLNNLVRICRWHHYLKTYHGYQIKRRGGRWLWESPNGPPHRSRGHQPRLSLAR